MIKKSLCSFLLLAVAFTARGDMTEIKEILKSKQEFPNVESFLKELKKQKPQLFKNSIGIKNSDSLQVSTLKEPRVLLYDLEGKISLSFVGNPHPNLEKSITAPENNPHENGYNHIEIISFENNNHYELYSLDFTQASLKPLLRGPNPEECMHCHMGETPNIDRATPWSEEEIASFIDQKVLGKSLGHSRYRFIDVESFKNIHSQGKDPLTEYRKLSFTHMRRQTLHRWVIHPQYQIFKRALRAALSDESEIYRFLPGDSNFWSETQERLLLKTYFSNFSEFTNPQFSNFKNYQTRVFAKLRFVLDPLNLGPMDMGLDLYNFLDSPEASFQFYIKELELLENEFIK